MHFEETRLKGAWLADPVPLIDQRGFFARTFCVLEFGERGLESDFVQHSISHSLRAGTLRGMHFQEEPHAEVKLVSCIKGAILDVIVDLRSGSSTHHQWASFELTAANRSQLYIPKGFAHGFMTLCDDVIVNYLISEFHVPAAARGLRYDDPVIGIQWPRKPAVISEKDRSWPLLESSE